MVVVSNIFCKQYLNYIKSWQTKKPPVAQMAFLNQIQSIYYSLLGFTKPNLASKLKVAWGTARKRALSISLPVTRQMP